MDTTLRTRTEALTEHGQPGHTDDGANALAVAGVSERRSSQVVDYSIFPLAIAWTITSTLALLALNVPILFVSVFSNGLFTAAILVLERVRPERDDFVPLDQPIPTELAHIAFDYQVGYGLAVGLGELVGGTIAFEAWPSGLPLAAQVALAIAIGDGISYWQHRAFHHNERLWPFHALHHSGSRLNAIRAARWHVVNIFAGAFLTFTPLVVLGAPESIFAWTAAFAGTMGILQHSNVRLRTPAWLDRWICTPAAHRFHHSSDNDELNGNYGTMLMIFDRVLGTYVVPTGPVPAEVGIVDDPVPEGFWNQLLLRTPESGEPDAQRPAPRSTEEK